MTRTTNRAFGEKVRVARTAAGLSTAEVGKRLGMHAKTVETIEKGRTGLGLPFAAAMAAALGCPTAELLPDIEVDAALSLSRSEQNLFEMVQHSLLGH